MPKLFANNTKTSKIIYKELSYKVVGLLFEVYNQLGSDFQEKYYQRALSKLLQKETIPFDKEFPVDIVVEGEKIGKNFIDFVISGKIAVDLKKGNRFRMGDIKQMLTYLRSSKLKLGIIAYFGSKGVRVKRIINSKV
ncbi:GxxExxY protein [Candidatus Woesebacteria bacterium]|nr:GxxExxY protein [Candidatus Woesebacteria bacterium]